LCGPMLRPHAKSLVGVDLSPAMIDLARRRAVYDAFAAQELTAYLRAHPATFDLIVSADTLVYFGDLHEVVMAAANALLPGGVLLFTVEKAAEDAGYCLTPHGRYAHSRAHLSQTLTHASLATEDMREVNLRKEAEAWVAGYLAGARKATNRNNKS